MIRHEVTIRTDIKQKEIKLHTLNRDLQKHREDDLPAERSWWGKTSHIRRFRYLKSGVPHRGFDMPAEMGWWPRGSLCIEQYYTNGSLFRPQQEYAFVSVEWWPDGNIYKLKRNKIQ
jgi:hypothetical protein